MVFYKNERSEVFCFNRWRFSLMKVESGMWMWILLRNKIRSMPLRGDKVNHVSWFFVKGGEAPTRATAITAGMIYARFFFFVLSGMGRG